MQPLGRKRPRKSASVGWLTNPAYRPDLSSSPCRPLISCPPALSGFPQGWKPPWVPPEPTTIRQRQAGDPMRLIHRSPVRQSAENAPTVERRRNRYGISGWLPGLWVPQARRWHWTNARAGFGWVLNSAWRSCHLQGWSARGHRLSQTAS